MLHTIARGETPELLSARYGIPVCMLLRANPHFRVGETISIPPPYFCSARRYTVRTGDTLYSIAQKHHIPMYLIPHPAELCAGETLLLPPPMRIHTCRPTDTVRSVAAQYGISEARLRAYNGISGGLYHGMQLILPPD